MIYKKAIFCCIYILTLYNICFSQNNKPDFLASKLDTSVRPGDDFFQYANGRWIKKNPIPDEESSWGITKLVSEENFNRLKDICEKAAITKNKQGTIQQKIGDFWIAAMDSIAIEKQGLKTIQPYLNKVNTIKDLSTLISTIASLNKIGVKSIIDINVDQDDKNSDAVILQLYQSGLYLPNKAYYLKVDTNTITIQNAYVSMISTFLQLSGISKSNAIQSAKNIFSIETSLAKSHQEKEKLRDPNYYYNKMSIRSFCQLVPNLKMAQYFTTLNIPISDSIIIRQPEYYKALNQIIKTIDISDWKMMLRFRLLETFTEALPQIYRDEKFKLTKLFFGEKLQKPKWKRVLKTQEAAMGELLGQLFVKKYFNNKIKKRYEDLVENIRMAYRERLQKLTWMSESTKQRALAKLAAVKKKVGYPDKWIDFSALQIRKDNYLTNLIRANQFWFQYNLNKLGKPADKEEWEYTPQTYYAYYTRFNNEIVILAARVTVPGYRDEELDDAFIYGYIGATPIGHELTHGFDVQCSKYDEKGNFNNWWTDEDRTEFDKRVQLIVNQFNNYIVIDTLKINGRATVSENIADLGGLLLGWNAFTKTKQYKENKTIAGLTPAQRYFLGYASRWLNKERKEALYNQILTDTQAPAKYRVNGSVVNVDAFYKTFNIKPSDKIYVSDSLRIRIW